MEDGARGRAPLRARHGRQQGPAHHQHGRDARGASDPGAARLQRQVHDRDRRGERLGRGPRRGPGEPGGVRGRRLRRFGRPSGAGRSAHRLPRRAGGRQLRPSLPPPRGRPPFRQLGRRASRPRDGPHPRHRGHRRTEGEDQGQGMAPGTDPQLRTHGARGRGARRGAGRTGGGPGLGGAGAHPGRERLRLELVRGAHDGDRRPGRPRERDPTLRPGALPASLHRGDGCRERRSGASPPPRRARLRGGRGPSAPARQRGRIRGEPDGSRRPVGAAGAPVDRADDRAKARDHPPDGGLDLQRRLHRHPRPSLDLDPAFLHLLSPARPRRAHPPPALPGGARI